MLIGVRAPRDGGKVQYCPLWTGNVPVYANPWQGNNAPRVDTLYVGGSANWFSGQCRASTYFHGSIANYWWAYTLGDNGHWGYVPQVFFSGGANMERDWGLYVFRSEHDAWCW